VRGQNTLPKTWGNSAYSASTALVEEGGAFEVPLVVAGSVVVRGICRVQFHRMTAD
jgi:hypothetical protein